MCEDLQPFHVVEKPGFQHLINTLDNRCEIPSRKSFRGAHIVSRLRAELDGLIIYSPVVATCGQAETTMHTCRLPAIVLIKIGC
ncbi:UNVERIFIED_CONTAM: hypothetical protein FKN15_047670 [Acipenser sinensis]